METISANEALESDVVESKLYTHLQRLKPSRMSLHDKHKASKLPDSHTKSVQRYNDRSAKARKRALAKRRKRARRHGGMFSFVDIEQSGRSAKSVDFVQRKAIMDSRDITCNDTKLTRVVQSPFTQVSTSTAKASARPVRILTPVERQLDEDIWYAAQGRFEPLQRRVRIHIKYR